MDAMNSLDERKRVLTIFGRRETQDGTSKALLRVRDAGIGFNTEARDRLFEPFYSTKPRGNGAGDSIVEAHGGRLWAETNLGKGATFAFSLPCAGDAKV